MHISDFRKIALHGVPRSGTTWVGEILNSVPSTVYRYQPLFSYAYKDYLGPSSSKECIDDFFSKLLFCDDEFVNQMDKRESGELPVFEKSQPTHIVYKEVRYHNILYNLLCQSEDIVLICLIRNPLSVVNSWLRAPREFRKDLGWSEMDEWQDAPKKNMNKPEEFNGYERWKDAMNIFLYLHEQYPERVYLLNYSELIQDPIGQAKSMLDFCELDYSQQTEVFLRESTSQEIESAYSVYRESPNDDKWKNQLNPRIVDLILSDLKGTDFERFLL